MTMVSFYICKYLLDDNLVKLRYHVSLSDTMLNLENHRQ